MKSDNKIGNLLRNADVLAACGALILLVGVTFFGVIMRYCLGDPFVWQEEVQLALIITRHDILGAIAATELEEKMAENHKSTEE